MGVGASEPDSAPSLTSAHVMSSTYSSSNGHAEKASTGLVEFQTVCSSSELIFSAKRKFHSLPWRPDEILPIELQGIPLVSLHAFKVFEPEAKHNHHKWLEAPDNWVP